MRAPTERGRLLRLLGQIRLGVLFRPDVELPVPIVVLIDLIQFALILLVEVAVSQLLLRFRGNEPWWLVTAVNYALWAVALVLLAQAVLLTFVHAFRRVSIAVLDAIRALRDH